MGEVIASELKTIEKLKGVNKEDLLKNEEEFLKLYRE